MQALTKAQHSHSEEESAEISVSAFPQPLLFLSLDKQAQKTIQDRVLWLENPSGGGIKGPVPHCWKGCGHLWNGLGLTLHRLGLMRKLGLHKDPSSAPQSSRKGCGIQGKGNLGAATSLQPAWTSSRDKNCTWELPKPSSLPFCHPDFLGNFAPAVQTSLWDAAAQTCSSACSQEYPLGSVM